MPDTADSTLSALKALIAAFQTGATPVTVKTSTAKAASLPPKFPGPDGEKGEKPAGDSMQQKTEYNERGRLAASRTQTEGNYASQHTQSAADQYWPILSFGKPVLMSVAAKFI